MITEAQTATFQNELVWKLDQDDFFEKNPGFERPDENFRILGILCFDKEKNTVIIYGSQMQLIKIFTPEMKILASSNEKYSSSGYPIFKDQNIIFPTKAGKLLIFDFNLALRGAIELRTPLLQQMNSITFATQIFCLGDKIHAKVLNYYGSPVEFKVSMSIYNFNNRKFVAAKEAPPNIKLSEMIKNQDPVSILEFKKEVIENKHLNCQFKAFGKYILFLNPKTNVFIYTEPELKLQSARSYQLLLDSEQKCVLVAIFSNMVGQGPRYPMHAHNFLSYLLEDNSDQFFLGAESTLKFNCSSAHSNAFYIKTEKNKKFITFTLLISYKVILGMNVLKEIKEEGTLKLNHTPHPCIYLKKEFDDQKDHFIFESGTTKEWFMRRNFV